GVHLAAEVLHRFRLAAGQAARLALPSPRHQKHALPPFDRMGTEFWAWAPLCHQPERRCKSSATPTSDRRDAAVLARPNRAKWSSRRWATIFRHGPGEGKERGATAVSAVRGSRCEIESCASHG